MKQTLENSQLCIYNAFYSNDRGQKIDAINYVISIIPNLKQALDNKWMEWSYQGIGRNIHKYPIIIVDDDSLQMNLSFCHDIITSELNKYYSIPVSNRAVIVIFFSNVPKTSETVIHEKNGKELTVTDFLSVLSYAKKVSEIYYGSDSSKGSETLLAIKTVELAINNQKIDKPLNKTLHLLNDIFTECKKKAQKDDDEKRTTSLISLLIDLAIDFIVQK